MERACNSITGDNLVLQYSIELLRGMISCSVSCIFPLMNLSIIIIRIWTAHIMSSTAVGRRQETLCSLVTVMHTKSHSAQRHSCHPIRCWSRVTPEAGDDSGDYHSHCSRGSLVRDQPAPKSSVTASNSIAFVPGELIAAGTDGTIVTLGTLLRTRNSASTHHVRYRNWLVLSQESTPIQHSHLGCGMSAIISSSLGHVFNRARLRNVRARITRRPHRSAPRWNKHYALARVPPALYTVCVPSLIHCTRGEVERGMRPD